MQSEYFSQEWVMESMQHDHLFSWLELFSIVGTFMKPGCKILDFGCSSGELLRLLYRDVPGLIEPVKPLLAVGLEPEAMKDTLLTAIAKTSHDLPIIFSHAPLSAFPNQFDLIISHDVIYLVEDLDATFEAAYTALKFGGRFYAATDGYIENEYYGRWKPQFEKRNIRALSYSKDTYIQSLKRAGFQEVDALPLRLTEETYARLRAERSSDNLEWSKEWFESEDDERHFLTEVGKLVFLGKKGELT